MQAVRQRRTSQDNSRGMPLSRPAIGGANGLRAGLLLAGLAGAGALVPAPLTTVIRITVGTTTRLASLDTELSGWDRHGPALLVVAGFALVMLAGARGGGAAPVGGGRRAGRAARDGGGARVRALRALRRPRPGCPAFRRHGAGRGAVRGRFSR